MDRLYKAVWEKVNEQGKMARALFQWAYDYKKRKILSGYDTPLFNRCEYSEYFQKVSAWNECYAVWVWLVLFAVTKAFSNAPYVIYGPENK